MQGLEAQLTRLGIFAVAVDLAGFIVGAWVLYHVIRAAIRDGIQESGLVETWNRSMARMQPRDRTSLPEMKAD